jgi:hypothetical protein
MPIGGPGNPAFSTTKTGRHDILEILLKVALSTKFKFKFKMFGSNTTNGHTHDSQNRLLSVQLIRSRKR